mgnify:CR=1 FL=1
MPETRPYIPWDVITNFMKDAFMGYGVPERDAEICTDVLVKRQTGDREPRLQSFQTDLYRQVRTGNIEPCHKY